MRITHRLLSHHLRRLLHQRHLPHLRLRRFHRLRLLLRHHLSQRLYSHRLNRLNRRKSMRSCKMGLMLMIRLRTSKCLKVLREMRQYSYRKNLFTHRLLKTFLKNRIREHSSLTTQVDLGVLVAMAET